MQLFIDVLFYARGIACF